MPMASVTLTTGNNLPPPQTPLVDPKTGILTNDGYQYFLGLINQLAGAATVSSVASGIKAQGTTQATAQPLSAGWNEVDVASAGNNGVLLDAQQPGTSQTVFNNSGTSINVYPPPGAGIDGLGNNAPYVLTNGLRQTFDFISTVQIRSGD